MTELSIGSRKQASLDLPKLVNLTELSLDSCDQLASLDLSKLVNLTELLIGSCDQLASLDLSKLVNLTRLSLESCKQLASVDVSGSKQLSLLEVSDCDSLDLIRCHTEAVPNLYLEDAIKKEEGDVTLIMSEEYAEKEQADSQEITEVIQADSDDCPYELMIYTDGKPIRATEIFTFDERTDEVDEIEELIKSGNTMDLWENYYGDGKLFVILDLWGGDDGDSDFALYEYDEDKGRYMEVASTICDEE